MKILLNAPHDWKRKGTTASLLVTVGEQNDVTDDSSETLQKKNKKWRKMKEMMLFQHVTSCGLYPVLTGWSEKQEASGIMGSLQGPS